ncbi:MSC_0882 family membrane protein [[Acholeplasma] multilocale]|uniref:MSC_0882 family membrane protein n=1 Tax=[Acholeplasma] multilocale TaxID=264638 RepID=UPI0006888108|nr:hypothetical protein [[Acholeplasma] multilocale]
MRDYNGNEISNFTENGEVRIDNGYNQQGQRFDRPFRELTPNFSKKELDSVEIPREIAKEIKFEKFRIFGILFIGFIITFISIFFMCLDLIKIEGKDNFLGMNPDYVPSYVGMMFLLALGIVMLLMGIVDQGHILKDVKRYKADLIMGREKIPYFIKRNYKALLARPIYVNWAAFFIYIFGGITIGIMYAVQAISKGSVNIKTEIIIMISIEIATLILHVLSLIFNRARMGNLHVYYDRDILPFEQIKDIKKRANRTCLILFFGFLAVVLFFIIIPIMIIRKRDGKSIIPFI